MDSAGTGQDIDYVLTTREICRLIKADHIDVSRLPECDFDDPLGEATGAGVIFGASGGVLEAALRTAYHTVTGENPEIDEQSPLKVLRQISSFKELEIDIKGVKLHCAALSSLGEARRLIQAMKRGECHYDFVEVMACPGGCINGGGQPIRPSFQNKPKDCADRDQCLRAYDVNSAIRFSHETRPFRHCMTSILKLRYPIVHIICCMWRNINMIQTVTQQNPRELPLSGFCVIHR